MKKVVLVLLCILVTIGIALVSYTKRYAIKDNEKQLENNVMQFINRTSVVASNINIKKELNLDNKKYILFSNNNTLGDAELIKGLNNKYKIKSTGIGSGYFRDKIVKTNKGKYLILKGKNIGLKIAYAKVILDNKEYKISIPQEEYFMVYCPVPIETKETYIEINNLKLYNKQDVDITNEMFKILFQ